jgi:tetratricopeptide (TPR) repeat protein
MLAGHVRQAVPTCAKMQTLFPRVAARHLRAIKWKFGWALVVLLVTSYTVYAQQQVRLIFGGPAPQSELTAPQVNSIPGTTESRLEQARALAAAGNWAEAVDIYSELAAESSDRVVAIDKVRYISLRNYCQLQLARMPTASLVAYRRRVDPLAERWYRDGLAARDERLLMRVLDELYCSGWGDDAVFALGELALERGDYDAARRYWEQISPLLRAPDGKSLWQSLHGIDLKANWPEIERRWNERKNAPDWLAYPDTQLNLADIRARLILASVRAGQLDRASLELDVFRRLHPASVGQLGGQLGPYVTALDKLLESAREWRPDPRSPRLAHVRGRAVALARRNDR